MEKLKTFEGLKHGDKIISPIDNEVTEFYIHTDGEKYLAGKTSLFPYFQFDPEDFYIYTGNKKVGEVDTEFFTLSEVEIKKMCETSLFTSGLDNGTDEYFKNHI